MSICLRGHDTDIVGRSSRGNCRQCTRERINRKYEEMSNAINEIKLSRGCADCGFNSFAVALDFDHVRGVKKWSVSHMRHQSWNSFLEEIEKCDVVCANCHRIRTYRRLKGAI